MACKRLAVYALHVASQVSQSRSFLLPILRRHRRWHVSRDDACRWCNSGGKGLGHHPFITSARGYPWRRFVNGVWAGTSVPTAKGRMWKPKKLGRNSWALPTKEWMPSAMPLDVFASEAHLQIESIQPAKAAYRYTYYCIPLLLLPHRREWTNLIALTSLIMPWLNTSFIYELDNRVWLNVLNGWMPRNSKTFPKNI